MKRQRVRIRALLSVASSVGCATLATAFSTGHIFATQRRRNYNPCRLALEMSTVSTGPTKKINNKYNIQAESIDDDDDSSNHAAKKPRIKFGLLPDFMQKDPLLVTKQRWEESKRQSNLVEQSAEEIKEEDMRMMTMSVASLALAIGVVYALASSAPEMVASDELEESTNVMRDLLREGNVERLELATRNIAATVLPQSAEDVIAVSIGEGIAGVIGAFATWLLGLVLNFKTSNTEFIITPLSESNDGNNVYPQN